MLFICILLFINCNGQNNKTYEKEKENMEKFNIKEYETRLETNPFYEGYEEKNSYIKQYHLIKDGYVEESYSKNIVTFYVEEIITDTAYKTVKKYYKDGSMESIKYFFNDNLEIGNWEYFQDGKVIKTENKDQNYKTSLNDIIAFGDERNVDFTKSGNVTREFSNKINKYIWTLDWNTGKQSDNEEEYLFKKIIIDDSDKKIIKEESYFVNPFVRK